MWNYYWYSSRALPPLIYIDAKQQTKKLIQNFLSSRKPQETLKEYRTCKIDLIDNKFALNKLSPNTKAVIGHAYGNSSPIVNFKENAQLGYINKELKISPNLRDFFLSNQLRFKTIFFTGDILKSPTILGWRTFKQFMKQYTNEVYIAPGNHDVGLMAASAKRDIFNQIFKTTYPLLLKDKKDYFLIIDTTQSNWSLSENAIHKLNNITGPTQNLFIFSHHILRPLPLEVANGSGGIPKQAINNYKALHSITPKFNKIYVFSGDNGKYASKPRFECLQRKNIHFISNGLGNLPGDEIILIDDGKVFRIKL